MQLLGLDFETTGLKIGVVSVVEVGMVLWDTDLHTPIKTMGFIVNPGPDAVWEPDVHKHNKATPEICAKFGMPDERAIRQTLAWYQSADAAVAHNGPQFDRLLLKHWAESYGYDWQPDKLWIDTMCDIPYPENITTRKLTHLAAEHEFLNPFPHRAMFDVMTMMRILDGYDINEVVRVASSPTLTVEAQVDREHKDWAKQRSFYAVWDNGSFVAWRKLVKECHLDTEREACKEVGFEIKICKIT